MSPPATELADPGTTGDAPPRGRRGLPDVPGPWETTVLAWRRLRRMSTALVLLLILAAATTVATFIPQRPVIPTTVAEWLIGQDGAGQPVGPGAGVAQVMDRLGLFDVYGAWWHNVLVVLLIVSLTSCLIPRVRGFARTARRDPVRGRNLDQLTQSRELVTPLDGNEAIAAARAVLRRRRYRVIDAEAAGEGATAQLAAEKGHLREGGSLVFHLSFYVLLLGAVLGHLLGFEGQVNVVEGRSFADTRVVYQRSEPGRFFGPEDHRGFVVDLESFDVDWYDDGRFTPREFASTVTFDGTEGPSRETVRVNHPVRYDDMTLYQLRFGIAPRLVVTNNSTGTDLYDSHVFTADAGGFAWTGVAPVATVDASRQIAVELIILPNAAFDDEGRPFSDGPRPDNVRMAAITWFGRLGLERNIPPTQFNRERGEQIDVAILGPGDSADVAGGALRIGFPEWSWWSGFQVSHQPGRGILLAGAVLLMAGLIPSLYAYRRRLWVEVRPEGSGSAVRIAGVALQRRDAFAAEHDAITTALRDRLGAEPEATPR